VWSRESQEIYRKCYLLHSLCNLSVGRAILPGVTANSCLNASTCIFIFISYYNALDHFSFPIVIGFIVLCIIIPTVTFEILSRVRKYAECALFNISQDQTTDASTRKTLNYFRVIQFRVGDFFCVRRTSILQYYLIVIDNVVTLILSFGKQT